MTDTDKNLLKCTVKKSVDVTKKLVLYASYAVCALTILWISGMIGIEIVIALFTPVSIIISAIWSVVSLVAAFLLSIPWYVYIGIFTIAAIPAYSFAWCVAREFTEEDWDFHGTDTPSSFTLTLVLMIPICIEIMLRPEKMPAEKYITSKIVQFPSAWGRHRRRVRGGA